MATYTELFELRRGNNDLRNRTAVAATIKAEALLTQATPTANEVTWAAKALSDPLALADDLLNYLLAANAAASTVAILAATDATLQTHVNTAADALIAGGVV